MVNAGFHREDHADKWPWFLIQVTPATSAIPHCISVCPHWFKWDSCPRHLGIGLIWYFPEKKTTSWYLGYVFYDKMTCGHWQRTGCPLQHRQRMTWCEVLPGCTQRSWGTSWTFLTPIDWFNSVSTHSNPSMKLHLHTTRASLRSHALSHTGL